MGWGVGWGCGRWGVLMKSFSASVNADRFVWKQRVTSVTLSMTLTQKGAQQTASPSVRPVNCPQCQQS